MGEALFAATERFARAESLRSLKLSVAEDNEPARRFYERLGFIPTGVRHAWLSNPAVTVARMSHPLVNARLRFAPSPVGDLHVGHVRIAALTWIRARQRHGSYFVRLENTDRAKEVPASRGAILADLGWLGLLGPEQPHDQVEMTESHRHALERLGSDGRTYRDGEAIRFRTPRSGVVEWEDVVRGRIAVRNEDFVDPVLVRSSGVPTFYLASTVDDIDDGITDLMRSEPFRRVTATQVHIWRALDARPPQIGHVPLVIGPRRAPVRVGSNGNFTVQALRERGIDPACLLMYLSMPEVASWKRPPTELGEVVERLDLRHIPGRPMTFDLRALESLNHRHALLAGMS